MDFIKETILTFSSKDKEEFERFISRKQVKEKRKDVLVFKTLYDLYTDDNGKIDLKGDQNYHAVRKRIAKELVNFLILKKSSADIEGVEGNLLMIKYFIDLARYEIAWELLVKEEKHHKNKSVESQLMIQQLKLSILPYYASEHFEETKQKIIFFQKAQIRKLQFQLSFIQIQKELHDKMVQGDAEFSTNIPENVFKQYGEINSENFDPSIYLRLIEIIRGEYLVQRKYKSFAAIAQGYYDKIYLQFDLNEIPKKLLAKLEYIMSHAYFRTRKFKESSYHMSKLKELIDLDNDIKTIYTSRYLSIKSAIDVFDDKVGEAILGHEDFIASSSSKMKLKERLNMSLNLVAYYCVDKSYKKANKILIYMNQSDAFYQRHMGREWLIRKELIRALIQVEIGNIEMAINILESLKKKHADMFAAEQYGMVVFYINTFLTFLKEPFQTSEKEILKMEAQTNFQKDNLFDDPKLLSFYVWLKSKITKQDLYELLKKEYQILG
jgi:hypothetical protein